MKRVRSDVPDEERSSLYRKAILVAIGGNLFLTIMKGFLAWISGSSAVFSDAANSLSDTLYSIIMGLGLYMSQRPADESHPQGHRQFEPLVSIFIGLALAVAGVAASWQSIQRFMGLSTPIALGWPTVLLLVAVVIKYMMYYLVSQIGDQVHSPAIRASARDNLADIITSFAALVGVWGSHFIHPYFDPLAGIFVALWIFKAAAEILWENFGYLTGRGASVELSHKIADTVITVAGVEDVHRIIADYIGPQLRVDMHITVDGNITLEAAHEISENVRKAAEKLPEVDLVYVHLEPFGAHEMEGE